MNSCLKFAGFWTFQRCLMPPSGHCCILYVVKQQIQVDVGGKEVIGFTSPFQLTSALKLVAKYFSETTHKTTRCQPTSLQPTF